MSANVMFTSPYYQVVEYPELDAIELMDTTRSTEILIQGPMAAAFRASLFNIITREPGNEPSSEDVDEMIGGYQALMNLPVCYH